MDWLIPSAVANLVGSLVLTFVYIYLYAQDRHRYLGIWAISWCLYAGRFVLLLVSLLTTTSAIITIGIQSAILISGLFLISGTYSFLDKPMPRWWLFGGGLGLIWITAAAVLRTTFTLLTAPNFTFMAVIYIWTGIILLKDLRIQNLGGKVTGWAFIIWGFHKFDYPFLRPVAWFAPWGYLLAALLELVVAIGFLLIYFQRTRKDLQESELRFRLAFQTSPDAVAINRWKDGQYILINDGFTSLTGYSQDEAVGKTIFDLYIWHNPEDRQNLINSLREHKQVSNMEARFRLRDGTIKTGLVSAKLITLNDVTHVLSMTRDIQDRIQAEASLRESEERYRSLFEENQSVMLLVDPETADIIDANGAAATFYGFSKTDLTDKKVSDIALPPPAEVMRLLNQSASGNGRITQMEQRLSGGEIRSVEIYCGPIRLNGRELLYALIHDITERLQREREMEAVVRVATALRSSESRAEILPVILNQALVLLKAEGASVGIRDPHSGDTIIELGIGDAAMRTGERLPVGKGVSGHVIESGQPHIKNYNDSEKRMALSEHIVNPNALVAIPLTAGDDPIGALTVGRKMEFTQADIRVLTAIGEIGANAIQRATLHEETQRRLQRLDALHKIDLSITASLDLDIILSVFLDHVTNQLDIDAAAILQFNRHSQTLYYAADRGFRGNGLREVRLQLGDWFAGQVALEQYLVAIPDIAEKEDYLADALSLALRSENFVTYYGVPLIAKGEVKGVLELFHRTALNPDPEWTDFLETLAGQAAIALDNAALFDDLQRSNLELSRAYDTTLEGWSRALDLRDRETEGHTRRVTDLTLQLAELLGMEGEQLEHLRRGALLHDIGKMGVPDRILNKPGPLDEDEWQVMKQHPTLAYELLSPIDYLRPALDIPYCHHEKWDGTGYPRGLKGEQIPLPARIFAVVDVWDALCSERPYRKAWIEEKAIEYIREQSGQHFDPLVVEEFLKIIQHRD